MRPLRILLFTVCLLMCISAVAQDSRADVTFGYSYLNNEEATGQRISMNGWYARVKVNLNSWFGLQGDSSGLYGTNPAATNERINVLAGGAVFTMPTKSKIKPFGYLELGDFRDSGTNLRTVDQLGVVVGGGFSFAVSEHLALQIVPGEYVMSAPRYGPYNNFSAKIGITIPLFRTTAK